MSVTTRQRMTASTDAVWYELCDFGGIAHWSPDLAMSTQLARHGIKQGAVRELWFARPRAGIETIRERIVSCGEHWFRYVLDDGFGPYKDAGSTWRVVPDGDGCIVEVESYVQGGPWWATLLTPVVHKQLQRGVQRALQGLDAYVASAGRRRKRD